VRRPAAAPTRGAGRPPSRPPPAVLPPPPPFRPPRSAPPPVHFLLAARCRTFCFWNFFRRWASFVAGRRAPCLEFLDMVALPTRNYLGADAVRSDDAALTSRVRWPASETARAIAPGWRPRAAATAAVPRAARPSRN